MNSRFRYNSSMYSIESPYLLYPDAVRGTMLHMLAIQQIVGYLFIGPVEPTTRLPPRRFHLLRPLHP
jgi:hypothetical protein